MLLDQENKQELKGHGFQNQTPDGVYAYMESLVSIKDKNDSGQSEEVEVADS